MTNPDPLPPPSAVITETRTTEGDMRSNNIARSSGSISGSCVPAASEEGELGSRKSARGWTSESIRVNMRAVNRLDRSAVDTMIGISRG